MPRFLLMSVSLQSDGEVLDASMPRGKLLTTCLCS